MIVAGVVPVLTGMVDPWQRGWSPLGLVLVGAGVLAVGVTARDFFRVGRGTLAPWDPPRHLVEVGLFAHCRNPMYVGVLLTIAGWAVVFGSPLIAGYALLMAVVFHLRVLLHEEPWAAKTFPEAWPGYVLNVPRWMPRLSPWRRGVA